MNCSCIKFAKRLMNLNLLLGILACATIAYGQAGSASLNGLVTDSSSAAVSGAQISVRNLDTNLTQNVTSDDQGHYQISTLPPGRYTVTVTTPGFQTYVQAGIVLTVNQAATLATISLRPGAVQETVNVTANAELLNTTSAEISTMVNQASVVQLPLNGRDPSTLVYLAPGTANARNMAATYVTGAVFTTETGASVNGGRQGSVFYLLDGVTNMDDFNLMTAPFPNADATQEFRIITNNFSAQYGFAPSGVVTIATKSGANQFHGVVFDFLRNQDLNAKNWFSHVVDPLRRNQFGGGIGGPIIKNKFFFFANYQGTRAYAAASGNVAYNATPAMLAGDFSGISTTLKAPFATVNGKQNQINPALFNPASVQLAKTWLPAGVAANGQFSYTVAGAVTNIDEQTERLDYSLSDKHRFMLRSYVDNLDSPAGNVRGNILSLAEGNQDVDYNEAFNHTWTINPTTVNVASIFYTQISGHQMSEALDSAGNDLCLSKLINVAEPYYSGKCYISGVSVTSAWSSFSDIPAQELRYTYGAYDTFTKSLSKHTVTAGANLQHEHAVNIGAYPGYPNINFNGSYTGLGLGDFLLGDAFSFTQGAGQLANTTGWKLGLFAQDEYRVKPGITVTLGLRWDPNTPPSEANGLGVGFRPGQQSTVYPNAPLGMIFPGDKGLNAALMPTTYNYWEPRLGVAWQPKRLPRTAFHGAFGVFTSPLPYVMYNHMALQAPFSPLYSFNGTSTTPISFSNPWASYAGTAGANPFPPFLTPTYVPPSNFVFLKPVTIDANFTPNFHLGITQSWNASVQQDLGHNFSLQVAYVASESYHMSLGADLNPGIFANSNHRTTYTDFGPVITNNSYGTASYQSLQVTADKRLSNNLQFQSNFTWSKTIDTWQTGNLSAGGSVLPNPFNLRFNRGTSALNVPIIWVSNIVYTTPSFSSKNALFRQVLGSWQVSAIVTSQSGTPITVLGGSGNNNSGSLQAADRANVVSGQSFKVRQGGRSNWLNSYFNTAAFTSNPGGTFGTSPKNVFSGPPINSTDMGIGKNWSLTEGIHLQFRWEMFNAFNHPDFGVPVSQVGASNFGKITGIGFIAPRVGQGALKLSF
jgi:hypothetical protein